MSHFYQFFRAKAGDRNMLANVIVFALLAFLFLTANHFKQTPLRMVASGTGGHLAKPQMLEAYGKLPMAFEVNQGQADKQVKFLARGSGYQLNLTATEAELQLQNANSGSWNKKINQANPATRNPQSAIVKMKLVNANPAPQLAGRAALPGKSHYYIGNDPKDWRINVANYAEVECEQAWPGIDLVYYGNQKQLEYDFIIAPGANPNAIQFAFDGAEEVKIDAEENLVLRASGGEVVMQKPVAYQEVNGERKFIAGSYQLRDTQSAFPNPIVGFHVGAYDTSLPLVIDPVLVYSTYLGPASLDLANDIAVDQAGNVYIAGASFFSSEGFNAFVAKLNAAGNALVYSTAFIGSKDEVGFGVAVDLSGNAYVTGFTHSTNFPVRNAFQPQLGATDCRNSLGCPDAFVAKLDAAGTIVYSTYLGGNDEPGDQAAFGDEGHDIAVDVSGQAYVTGSTISKNFPVKNAYQPAGSPDSHGRVADGFVTKFSASGNELIYSTYLGGKGIDDCAGIAIDAAGNAYVTGVTYGDQTNNFPTTASAFQRTAPGGLNDGFVTKLNSTGNALVYSTFLGGTNGDQGEGIAVDSDGNAYVIGNTSSTDFPLESAHQSTNLGGSAFVTKLNPGGTGLLYSSYLGKQVWFRTGNSPGAAITVDAAGNAYVIGSTSASDFPTVDALYPNFGGVRDAYIAKINTVTKKVEYATFLGGSDIDEGYGIAVDAANNVYVTGRTASTNFPLKNPAQATLGGSFDVFVTKISGDAAPLPTVCVWQEFSIYRGAADFSANKESNIVTFDKQRAEVISASKDSLIVRVPPDLVGNRNNVLTLPDTTLREVAVVARVVRAPGDTVMASESRVRFCPPYLLLYDEVTRPAPPLVQRRMPARGPRNRQAFLFIGNQNDGTAAVRVLNTSTAFPQPSTLLVKVIAPSGELFDKSTNPTIGNLLNIGQNNAGIQFPVTQSGIYIIIVEADRTSSFGPFPAMFQIHLAGNAGLPRKLINGNPEPSRAIRFTTLFNHPAPQPEILANAAPALGTFAETALFKFANPVSTSQFPIAVLIPPAIDPAGFPFGIPPVRAAAPLVLGLLPNGLIDISVPSATTPGAVNPVPGTVVDLTQVPIPASVLAPGPPPGVAAILGATDGNGVTLPITLPAGGVITSLIADIGSGNEIVDGNGADFRVLGIGGAYAVAVSNTPFSNTFVALGSGTGQQDFDLSATGLTSIRYIRLSVPTGSATIDAIQSLHFFVDTIHPTIGPLADVGFATITMRRQKSPATPVDCLLELIAPDGSFQGKNESGFGDETSQDRSDAALIKMQLTQQGFYRYLGRGYDTQPDAQAFGNFFTRLETAGNYDQAKIQISSNSESGTVAQKRGLIDSPRQRDSFLFEAAPGTTLSLVVNGVSNPSPALADPLIELYDPEDFLIAANDNFPGRGKNAALTVTLPTSGRAGGAFPNPSTYRIVVCGIDGESGAPVPVSNGVAHLRAANGGNYELKVFTGTLAGGAAPTIAGITPSIAAQGATNLAIVINGNNFVNGARVTFSESGITTKTVNFVSSNQLQATIDIDVTAAIGRRNVLVTNPDAQSGTGTGVFEIRKSLGTSILSWEAPPSGQALAPPMNLRLQFGGSRQNAKTSRAGHQKSILKAGKRRSSGSPTKGQPNLLGALRPNSVAEIEPNNNPEQAQVLMGASPLLLNGNAEVNDAGDIILSFSDTEEDDLEDLFQVTTTAPGLSISLDGFTSDCDLYLFNSDLSEIIDASNTVDVNPPEEIDLPELEVGTYFIAVSIYDPDPIGADTTAYVLTLQGQFAGKATLQSYNIFRSTSANARSTGTRVGTVNANTTGFADPIPHTGNFFYQVTAVYDQGESAPSNEATILVTNVEAKNVAMIPVGFDLRQNYPNPFSLPGIFENPETRIQFELPKPSHVRLEIFNVQGQKIRTLVDEPTPAGSHTVNWDGRMDSGEPAVSGIYVYRFKTQEYEKSRKLLLLR
jgi:FlgD Ig-like domain/Beta-propeller repeat/IPT/TIG domain